MADRLDWLRTIVFECIRLLDKVRSRPFLLYSVEPLEGAML